MMVKHTVCPSCSAGCGVNLIEIEGSPVGTTPTRGTLLMRGRPADPAGNAMRYP